MAFQDFDIDKIFDEAQSFGRSRPLAHFGESGSGTAKSLHNIGVSSSSRTSEVAGDGFLYDDGRTGRWTDEMREAMIIGLRRLFECGLSIRAIVRITGISPATVRYYRCKLSDSVRPCACGQPATHQGWCAARFRASWSRQDFMRSWHPDKRWPLVAVNGLLEAWGKGRGG